MVTFKEFFSFKNNRFFWLNLIAMIVVMLAAAWGTLQWLDKYTRHGEAVVVPDIKGKALAQAGNEITKQKLRFAVIDSSYVKGMPAGAVLEQSPAGGMKVKEGRTIYLTINTDSAPKVSMPDIMDNSSLRQADAKLRALGFKVAEPVYISGEKDWVYSVTYKGRELHAGEKIPREALVTLHVGDGHESLSDSTAINDSLNITDDKPVIDESWF